MITLAGAVIGITVYLIYRWGHLSLGSVLVGVLVGLVLAGTAVGSPIATAVHTTATEVGQSVKAGINEAIK